MRWGLLLLCFALCWASVRPCTTIVAGKRATATGAVIVGYSSDGDGTSDPRLVEVPAQDWPAGSTRAVWSDNEVYPRYVGYERRIPAYYPKAGQTISVPVGYIPQVPHTYSFLESVYGVLNENGVGLGESSCSARLFGSYAQGAIMSMDELSRLAMERARTAREAVNIVGSLAEEFGFVGVTETGSSKTASYPVERGVSQEGGEALIIADSEEAFVFHVLSDGCPNNKCGAVWVAQRVEDGEATVVANMFTVREVDLKDSFRFLYSKNMLDVARQHGWWSDGEPFDFTAVYSGGEYSHQYYSGRRMWRALSLMGGSNASLAPDYAPNALLFSTVYPFSVAPSKPLSVADFKHIYRDYYAGTQFDLSQTPANGPWGNPARFDGSSSEPGAWERSIGMHRTTYSLITSFRSGKGYAGPTRALLLYGSHSAWGTVYAPFYAGHAPMTRAYSSGSPAEMDRTTAYWAHRYALNLVYPRWQDAYPVLQMYIGSWEAMGEALTDELDAHYANLTVTQEDLYAACNSYAEKMVAAWASIPDLLMQRFVDGYTNYNAASFGVENPNFYPASWLVLMNFTSGPGYGTE